LSEPLTAVCAKKHQIKTLLHGRTNKESFFLIILPDRRLKKWIVYEILVVNDFIREIVDERHLPKTFLKETFASKVLDIPAFLATIRISTRFTSSKATGSGAFDPENKNRRTGYNASDNLFSEWVCP